MTTLIAVLATPAVVPAEEPYKAEPLESALWGKLDEAGNTNTQTSKKLLEATKLIRKGKKYMLGHDYEMGMPSFPGNSWVMEMKPPTPLGRHVGNIEYFHGEIGQNGTQLDALGHFGIKPDDGDPNIQNTLYYNRFRGHQVHGQTGLQHLGVEKLKPFFTRGILIDVSRHQFGGAVLPEAQEITMDHVRKTLTAQGMTEDDIREGDVVLFRTGWEQNWRKGTLDYYKGIVPGTGGVPGIGLEVAQWLASKKVACVGADNWGVEFYPNNSIPDVPSPVHNELIVKNGIPHQESMHLSELADAAAEEKRNGSGPDAGRDAYTFAYIFVPVPVKGASGSPGIPMAVK
jgi:kynurenine formamidase